MTNELKQAYIDKMNAQLSEMVAKVDVLKARIAIGGANARIDLHEHLKNWQHNEEEFRAKLSAAKDATTETYEAAKNTVQTAWEDLSEKVKTFLA